MAISVTLLTAGGSSSPATSFDTASVSPTVGSFVVVALKAFQPSSGSPTAPAISGCSLTWTPEAEIAYYTVAVPTGVLSVQSGSGTPSSGAIHIDFGLITYQICRWQVFEISGCIGFAQSNAVAADVGYTASVPLGSFADSANGTLGVFASYTSGATWTIESGSYTELHDESGMMVEWRADNDEDLSVDATVTTEHWAAAAFEIQAPPITGVLDETLEDFTLAASGIGTIYGTFSQTIEDFTLAASGIGTIYGTFSQTIEDFTLTSSQQIAAFAKTVGHWYDPPAGVPPSELPRDQDESAIDSCRDMLLLDTSLGRYLTAIGQLYGIKRPKIDPNDDELYRRIIQAIALQPKTVLATLYWLMEAIFGSQALYTSQGRRPWRIYEVVVNEFVVEVPFDILGTSNANASYLHGFAGKIVSGATVTEFDGVGDATAAAASLAGLSVAFFNGDVVVESQVAVASYDPDADLTHFTVSPAFASIPASGSSFFVDVPGDEISSFRGDYLSPTAYLQGTATAVAANSLTDVAQTMVPGAWVGYYLRTFDGKHFLISNNSSTAFVLAADGAIPGLGPYSVVKVAADADEAAGEDGFAPASDRVYLTGDGLLEVAKQYILELVRGAGIVARFEKI